MLFERQPAYVGLQLLLMYNMFAGLWLGRNTDLALSCYDMIVDILIFLLPNRNFLSVDILFIFTYHYYFFFTVVFHKQISAFYFHSVTVILTLSAVTSCYSSKNVLNGEQMNHYEWRSEKSTWARFMDGYLYSVISWMGCLSEAYFFRTPACQQQTKPYEGIRASFIIRSQTKLTLLLLLIVGALKLLIYQLTRDEWETAGRLITMPI